MNKSPSKEELEKYYLENKYPMWRVAEILNISVGSVHKYIKMYGIPSRSQHTGFKGKTHTDETKKHLSNVLKGREVSLETRAKVSESRKIKGMGHRKQRKDGYVSIFYPDYPSSSKDGFVMEHIYLMEQSIGRLLKDDEVVHHINHIRSDNRIENLQLMTFKEHASLHMKERWAKKKGEMTYQYGNFKGQINKRS